MKKRFRTLNKRHSIYSGIAFIVGGFIGAFMINSFGGILGRIGGYIALAICLAVMFYGICVLLDGNGKKDAERH